MTTEEEDPKPENFKKEKKVKTRKKGIMEKLGLERVHKLNKTICKNRVTYLRKEIKKGKYKGQMLEYAKYYAAWYSWMAENGGTRAA